MSFLKFWNMGNAGGKPGSSPSDLTNTGNERYFGLENTYSYPVSPALLTAAAENIILPSSTASLKTVSSTASLNGNVPPATGQTAKDSKPSTLEAAIKADKKRKESGKQNGPTAKNTAASPPALLDGIEVEEEGETLLTAMKDLFLRISTQKKKTGALAPQQFVNKLKKENELFRSTMHQDAHEMLNYTLNAIAEILLRHKKVLKEKIKGQYAGAAPAPETEEPARGSSATKKNTPASWVHALFEGLLTNETKCLTCETVTNKEEAFLDLSVDIDQHSSLSSCLRSFSSSETLCQKNKFFCDQCGSLQEAEKRMKVKQLPNVLAVHLKRFKYQEKLQRYIKLSYRVVFPRELRLFNTADDAEDPERLYKLFAVIVHVGSGPYHGHYVTLVKSHEQWLLFDDDDVTPVEESELQRYYGDSSVGSGYIFFYMAEDFDPSDLVKSMLPESEWGAEPPPPEPADATTDAGPNSSSPAPGSVATGGGPTSKEKRKMSKRPSVSQVIAEAVGGAKELGIGKGRDAGGSGVSPGGGGGGGGSSTGPGESANAPTSTVPTNTNTTTATTTTTSTIPLTAGVLVPSEPGLANGGPSVVLPNIVVTPQSEGPPTKEGWGWFSIGKKDKDKGKDGGKGEDRKKTYRR
ncbi:hypothetical protein HK104_001858 [Borealophlyctis nickersoniae]|nr:hypothetical protein HK104_001858 [Borealophlyctis nickersoniae]